MTCSENALTVTEEEKFPGAVCRKDPTSPASFAGVRWVTDVVALEVTWK